MRSVLRKCTHLIVRKPLRLKQQHRLTHVAVVVGKETLQKLLLILVSCEAEHSITVATQHQSTKWMLCFLFFKVRLINIELLNHIYLGCNLYCPHRKKCFHFKQISLSVNNFLYNGKPCSPGLYYLLKFTE